jgi:hypothetical protein
MTTSILKSVPFYVGLFLTGGIALATVGCDSPGAEGDSCVPSESHNDCSSGLTCTQPALCSNYYCCGPGSTDPNCQKGCNGGAQNICEASKSNAGLTPGYFGTTMYITYTAAQVKEACDFALKNGCEAGACADDGGVP